MGKLTGNTREPQTGDSRNQEVGMRIVLIGQAAFGAGTLDAILEKGENVVAVYTPKDRPGGKFDPLKELALSRGIPVFQPATYKSDDAFSEYRALEPDLTIMAFVTDIIPARYFDAATIGAINYHPSLLPRHRGASAINWAIIMGDTRTGLTIFWPDGGIDTGPILLQKEVDIGPDDTTGSVYFNHLFPMGIAAILESLELIRADRAPRIPQDESAATYEPPCNDKVARVDWHKSARDIYNLVRGCDPQPGAFTDWKEDRIRFYEASLKDEPTTERPGTIVASDQHGLHIAVAGGRLIVGRVRSSTGKESASTWASQAGCRIGDRFE